MGDLWPGSIARVTSSAIECRFQVQARSLVLFSVDFFLSSVVPQQHLQDIILVICSLLPLPTGPHTWCILSLIFSFMSLCTAWGIRPPDCCPQRAPRRGQGPRSSVSRLTHGEWSRPILHGPRRRLPPRTCGGVPLQWIPFSEEKGELTSHWTDIFLSRCWLHHLRCANYIIACLYRCQHTASVRRGVHKVLCSSLSAGASTTPTPNHVSQRVVYIWN